MYTLMLSKINKYCKSASFSSKFMTLNALTNVKDLNLIENNILIRINKRINLNSGTGQQVCVGVTFSVEVQVLCKMERNKPHQSSSKYEIYLSQAIPQLSHLPIAHEASHPFEITPISVYSWYYSSFLNYYHPLHQAQFLPSNVSLSGQ